jgi:Skp family chaperone for outer membrane proteins
MSRSLELVNRHPHNSILSIEIMMPRAGGSPGSLKRRTAPRGIKIPPNGKVELCKTLECDYATAKEAFENSPQAQHLKRRGWLLDLHGAVSEDGDRAARTAVHAANSDVKTPAKVESKRAITRAEDEAKRKEEEAEARKKAAARKEEAEARAAELRQKAAERATAAANRKPEPPKERTLADMDKAELVGLAKSLDINVKRGMKVATLVKLIEEAQAATAPEGNSEE